MNGRNDHVKIDKSFIIQSALELLQERGIKKLSIRNVAEKVNIKGASLYWHIKNKNELLSLISDEICKDVHYPDEHETWDRQIIELTSQYREALLKVRDSAYVLMETPPTTPFRLKLIKKISDLFEQLGMKKEDISSASWILNNYVTSFVIEEYRFNEVKNEQVTSAIIEDLPFDVFEMDMDKEFKFGLDVLIEGFKSKV